MPLLCNTALRVLAITVRKDRHTDRQINQWHFNLKRGRIIYVHSWHDLKCRNPKYATKYNVINKKLIQQSNKDIHQSQCWKSVAHLYINDQSEKEIKKTVLFTIVSGRINYLVIEQKKWRLAQWNVKLCEDIKWHKSCFHALEDLLLRSQY